MSQLVSVIIPNFNHADYLEQRINSVLSQSYQHFEVILLDDCSTDDSPAIIEKYRSHPKVSHVVCNTANSGSTFRQWQKGLSLASGELVWIAESDDFNEPTFLETAISHFNKDQNLHLFFCKSVRVDETGKESGSFQTWLSKVKPLDFENDFSMGAEAFAKNALITINVVMNASGVVFRKAAVKTFFNELYLQFRYCGDWYFWAEVALGGNVSYSAAGLNNFRCHQNTTRAAKPFEQQTGFYIEELMVLQLIGGIYNFSITGARFNKTLDNIITITPFKKLLYPFRIVFKKIPSLLPRLAVRFIYRALKKIRGRFL